jgi:RHS repeat-associated protein
MNGYAANSTMSPPIPVWGELGENSRLGFEGENPAWRPVSNAVNSTTTIGFRASLFLDFVRQIHSARYYNPATGRFMSRGPENGNKNDPASLHTYLYASGDPVNGIDSSGRQALLVYVSVAYGAYAVTYSGIRNKNCIVHIFNEIASAVQHWDPIWAPSSYELANCLTSFSQDLMWPFPGVPPPWTWGR